MSAHELVIFEGQAGQDPERAAFLVHAIISECARQQRLDLPGHLFNRVIQGVVALTITRSDIRICVEVANNLPTAHAQERLEEVRLLFSEVVAQAYAKTYPTS